ncbi:hypothetical protein GGR77_004461 [Xanthomonas translucens]
MVDATGWNGRDSGFRHAPPASTHASLIPANLQRHCRVAIGTPIDRYRQVTEGTTMRSGRHSAQSYPSGTPIAAALTATSFFSSACCDVPIQDWQKAADLWGDEHCWRAMGADPGSSSSAQIRFRRSHSRRSTGPLHKEQHRIACSFAPRRTALLCRRRSPPPGVCPSCLRRHPDAHAKAPQAGTIGISRKGQHPSREHDDVGYFLSNAHIANHPP